MQQSGHLSSVCYFCPDFQRCHHFADSAPADSYGYLAASYFHAAMVLAMWVASHEFFLETLFSAGVTGRWGSTGVSAAAFVPPCQLHSCLPPLLDAVGLMYIGGSHVLAGTLSVGALYAMLRYTAVVESGYTALSEGVARFYASYGALDGCGH